MAHRPGLGQGSASLASSCSVAHVRLSTNPFVSLGLALMPVGECTVYVYRLCIDSPRGYTKLPVSKEPGPLEGKVEINVSLNSESPFPDIFQMAVLSVWGAAVPGEGLSEPGHLCLCLKAQNYLRCP